MAAVTEAWKECNRRLFNYYETFAPLLPNSFREMEHFSQHGVLLATIGADEPEIQASFGEAIRIAEQKAISLQKRAEETYPEYRRQKGSPSGGRGVRVPLWWQLAARCLSVDCGKPSVIKRRLEMQSEHISATRDPLKETCLARGVWMNS